MSTNALTPERVQDAVRLFTEEKLSHHSIAKYFNERDGLRLTKGQIVGKLSRMGIVREDGQQAVRPRAKAEIDQDRSTTARMRRKLTNGKASAIGEPAVLTAPQPSRLAPHPVIRKPDCRIEALEQRAREIPIGVGLLLPGLCRWPFDAPADFGETFIFCAQMCAEGRSYCEAHHSLAYQPRTSPEARKYRRICERV